MWRDDVLGIDHSTGRPCLPQQPAPVDSTPVCEDEILFASFAEKHCYVRETTNKKGKKLDAASRSLDGDGFLHRRVLHHQPERNG